MSVTPAEADLGPAWGLLNPLISHSCVSLLPMYPRVPPAPVLLPTPVTCFHSALRYLIPAPDSSLQPSVAQLCCTRFPSPAVIYTAAPAAG
jgi:hypothetical protein